jgi:tetratricopeptide (TPR) repeat protein
MMEELSSKQEVETTAQAADELGEKTATVDAGSVAESSQPQAAKNRTKKPVLIVVLLVLACAGAGAFYYTQVFQPAQSYAAAAALFDQGEYKEAKKAFDKLGDYQDSAERMLECDYHQAVDLYNKGDYKRAVAIFSTIYDYNDSRSYVYSAFKKLAGQDYVDKATLGIEHMNNYITSQASSVYGAAVGGGTWSPSMDDPNLKSMQKVSAELGTMGSNVKRAFSEDVLASCGDDNLRDAYEKFEDLHDAVSDMLSLASAIEYTTDMVSGSSSNMTSDATTVKSAMESYTKAMDKLK